MASQHTAVARTGAPKTPAARGQSVRASSPATFRGEKRPTSPASCSPLPSSPASCSSESSPATPASNNNNNCKKRKAVSLATPTQAQIVIMEASSEVNVLSGLDVAVLTTTEPLTKPPAFKDPNFTHSGIGGAAAGKKNRTWKNLKQILSVERTFPWSLNDPNYYNIDAPSSFTPAKKYSDISGLPANYTDPQTKLRFTSSDEFTYIRLLPTDVVTGYLALRKATCVVP